MPVTHFRLEPESRRIVLEALAAETGTSCRVISRSGRTDAQLVALLRDLPHCRICLHIHNRLRPIHEVHHVDARRNLAGHDVPERCLSLCWECHRAVHNGLISREVVEEALYWARKL